MSDKYPRRGSEFSKNQCETPNLTLIRSAAGVSVLRWTTEDFVHWAPSPMEVLFLPNGAPGDVNAPRDGNIWTVKSMDRNTTHYLLFAYYGDSAATFVSPRALTTHSFKPTLAGGNFKDHDDTNREFSTSLRLYIRRTSCSTASPGASV